MIDLSTRLADLPSTEPTPECAARIRRRCRAELVRRAPSAVPRPARYGSRAGPALWPAAAASLCVAYVAEVIAVALDVLRSR